MTTKAKSEKSKKSKSKKTIPVKTKKDDVLKLEKLSSELAEQKLAFNALEDRHLRLRAEFDNYRKQKEKEISRLFQYGGSDAIVALLPVVDDMKRLVNSTNGDENVSIDSIMEGVQLILDKVSRRLERLDVVSFDSVGEKFDPDLHDALMVKESGEHEENIVIEEFEKGYRMKDKVIRHAKVVVSK
jgi:molecular chaperone GrpE